MLKGIGKLPDDVLRALPHLARTKGLVAVGGGATRRGRGGFFFFAPGCGGLSWSCVARRLEAAGGSI